jgi:diguanylate cyclase (GGDEF)-like protein/PAS domain S-box-containing protein
VTSPGKERLAVHPIDTATLAIETGELLRLVSSSVASAPGGAMVPDLTREVLRAIPNIALFVFDRDLRFVFCEGSSLHDAGLDPRALEGRTLYEVLPDRVDELEPPYRRALAGETVEFETAHDGRDFSARAAPMRDASGTIVGASLLSVDVTDGHALRRQSLERLDRIASNVPGVVYQLRVGADGVVTYPYVSEGIREVIGIEPGELQDDPPLLRRLIHPDDLESFELALARTWDSDTPSQWEGRMFHRDGTLRWLRIASRPAASADGEIVRDGVAIDVTEQRAAEETARWRLEHDSLTGLPTRSLFFDRLEQALVQSRTRGSSVGVCFVDIDRFKQINDALGHAAGDEVLHAVAERVRECLRPEDSVARHGGDELTVLFPALPNAELAAVLAARIADACRRPLDVAGTSVSFTCSIGVAVSPDDGTDAAELLSHADAAKHRAKEHGRARIEVFDPELARQNERRAWLDRHLRLATERNELHLVYQRQDDLTGRCASVEALLRWTPTGHEPVPPSVFIPLAEELGLIGPIGEWVLRRACETAVGWLARDAPLRVCVNLSPCQLADPGFASFVFATLADTGLPASLLELELTETALIDEGASAIGGLGELRARGVTISLDDFGTGYSSLARLRHLPLDALKIDGSFVAEIGKGPGTAIVRSIIELGHILGLEVVGEGVETAEQQRVLRALGCDRLQGYLIGYPLDHAPPKAA